ncbi:MAG TPA: hypothetical protein VF743_10715 [Acidimicrobiales bacterium]
MPASAPSGPGPDPGVRGPSLIDLVLELPRSNWELGGFVAMAPVLRAAPAGDGHPVLVLPGFQADDLSTLALRTYLRTLGYPTHGWRLGRNIGPTPEVVAGMLRAVRALRAEHGRRPSLVGWSLGGVYARELARLLPDDVRQVITLGSPFNVRDMRQTRTAPWYRRLEPRHDGNYRLGRYVPSADPPPVPSTAVYTRGDGIVSWETTVQRAGARAENVEVRGSHCGLGHNAAVVLAVADRLAQREGTWAPFRPAWPFRRWYPAPVAGPPGGPGTHRPDRPAGPDDEETTAWTA